MFSQLFLTPYQARDAQVRLPACLAISNGFISKMQTTSHNIKAKQVPYQCVPFQGQKNFSCPVGIAFKCTKVVTSAQLTNFHAFIQEKNRAVHQASHETTVSARRRKHRYENKAESTVFRPSQSLENSTDSTPRASRRKTLSTTTFKTK